MHRERVKKILNCNNHEQRVELKMTQPVPVDKSHVALKRIWMKNFKASKIDDNKIPEESIFVQLDIKFEQCD